MGSLTGTSPLATSGDMTRLATILGLAFYIWAALTVCEVGGFPLDKKAENVANALMYLNQLDQLYSNQIRPSTANVAHLSKKAGHQLKLIGDSLSLRARPRFGKRGDYRALANSPQYYPDLAGLRINNADILE